MSSSPNARAAPSPPSDDAPLPVLLYDGECGLCYAIVRLLLRRDASGRLHFAALQSAPAQEFLRAHALPTRDFDSLVFVPDWRQAAPTAYQLRTDGVVAALAFLPPPWRWLAGLRFLPRGLRDGAYRLVARSRYAVFGRYRPRPLARSEWEQRFLAR